MSLINVDAAMLAGGEVDVTPSNEVDPTVARLQALLHQRGHNIDELQAEVVRLKQQVEAEKQAHAADVDRISGWLLSEARERDWCSDYDDAVSDLNPNLSVKLRCRTREYAVTVRVTYEVTRTVNETSADAAWDYVNEDWDPIHQMVRSTEPEKVERVNVSCEDD